METKKNILFVCTNNAGRSQITEAVFRREYSEYFNVQSAGVDPWDDIHHVGRALMNKNGYSMEGHVPKHVDSIDFDNIDVVVTIGDPAEEGTRELRGNSKHIHWDLGDPARADGTSDSESVFVETKRRIENKIKVLIKTLASDMRIDDYYWVPGVCSGIFRDDKGIANFEPKKNVPMIAEKGFKVMELSCYIPGREFDWRNNDDIKELMSVSGDYGIDIWSAHPPENMVLLGEDEQARQDNLDMLKDFAEFANEIGAAHMPIHLWSTTRSIEEVKKGSLLDRVVAELEKISRNNNICIMLETLRSNASAIKNDELLEILSSRDTCLGMIMDSGHAQISGDLHDITIQAGKYLKSLHLHDNNGVTDTHQIPGTGVTDWESFADDLKTANYSGPIMYEVGFIRENDLEMAMDKTFEHYQKVFSGFKQ